MDEYMNMFQELIALGKKLENRDRKDRDKDTPIKLELVIDSDGVCNCPICGERIDLYKMYGEEQSRCKSCNQLYEIVPFYT